MEKKKPETINYRTFKPERTAFCAKFSDRIRTTNAFAENTRDLNIGELFARSAE